MVLDEGSVILRGKPKTVVVGERGQVFWERFWKQEILGH